MTKEPKSGDRGICRHCGGVIWFYDYTQWNGTEYESLDTWWSHGIHPEDGHEAEPKP